MNERLRCSQTFRPFLALCAAMLLVLAAVAKTCLAQAPGASPSFEVASVRPENTCTGFSISPEGSRYFSANHISMAFLISMAYGIGGDQLVKHPGWIATECYSVTARAAGTGSLSNDQLKPLLQNLLAHRFQLAVHSEVKEFSGYALVVAKGGPKLNPTKGGHAGGSIRMDGLRAQDIPLSALAKMLTHSVGAHVIDKTGLTGRYDINISFVPDASLAPADSSLPSIFTALPQQLGLKLVSQKIPVKMLYIDHIDKVPTEN